MPVDSATALVPKLCAICGIAGTIMVASSSSMKKAAEAMSATVSARVMRRAGLAGSDKGTRQGQEMSMSRFNRLTEQEESPPDAGPYAPLFD